MTVSLECRRAHGGLAGESAARLRGTLKRKNGGGRLGHARYA